MQQIHVQAYRQPLMDAVQLELRARGFQPMTPESNRSPIVSFVYENTSQLKDRLAAAEVSITLSGNRFRISPSVFNDMNDIDRFLDAIGHP